MPNSPLPTPLQDLGARRFSFYPAIRNLEHNEWQFRRATWSEIVVVNTRSGDEAFIPRACIGEVSIIDHPVVIVGLHRELEWRDGAVYPHRRPVIEFPIAVNDRAVNDSRPSPAPHPDRLAPVVNIRLEPRPAKRKSTRIAGAVMLGAIGCLVVADLARQIQSRQRVRVTSNDNYASIVAKLGLPAADRAVAPYRVLSYPRRHLSIVLSETAPGRGHYLGTVDSTGHVLDSMPAQMQDQLRQVLRSLPRI